MNLLLSYVPWYIRWSAVLCLTLAVGCFVWLKRGEWDEGRQAEVDLTRTQLEDKRSAIAAAAKLKLQARIDDLLAARELSEQQHRAALDAAIKQIEEAPHDSCIDARASDVVLKQLRDVLP